MSGTFSTSTASSAAATGISMSDLRARIQDMFPRHIPLRGFFAVVNSVVEQIHQRGKWGFNYKQAIFSTVDDYSTGSVAVTNASATVTGTGTTFASAHAGRKIRISGVEYEISTQDSATQVTLTETYSGSTDSGVSYVIYQDEYNLASDVKTIYRMWDLENERELRARPQLDLRGTVLRQFTSSSGDVREYADIGFSSTNLRRVLIYPYPAEVARIEYWYERQHTKVDAITDQVDTSSTLDETVVQGVYARFMQLNQSAYPVQERQLAGQLFRQLLERQWKTDQPLRDITIRMGRRDGFSTSIQRPGKIVAL